MQILQHSQSVKETSSGDKVTCRKFFLNMFELSHSKEWKVACGRNGWIELFCFKMHKTKVDANKPEICFGAFSWNKCATQALGLPDNKIT